MTLRKIRVVQAREMSSSTQAGVDVSPSRATRDWSSLPNHLAPGRTQAQAFKLILHLSDYRRFTFSLIAADFRKSKFRNLVLSV